LSDQASASGRITVEERICMRQKVMVKPGGCRWIEDSGEVHPYTPDGGDHGWTQGWSLYGPTRRYKWLEYT
jgi:hypothetical protein